MRSRRAPAVPTTGLSSGLVAAAATAVLAASLTVLSLSDAVPGTWKRVTRHLPFPTPEPLTSFSSGWGVHFVAWTALTFAAVHMVRRWTARVGVAFAVLGFGVLVELGQERFSTLRSFQSIDLVADLRGVILGFTAAVCVNALRSQLRGDRHQMGG